MSTPFRLDQHPRRPQPLSTPPTGYFEQLPTRLMAQVAAPPRRSWLAAWLQHTPVYLRTGLASTLLLGTFAASLWLGGGQPSAVASSTSLSAVPQDQLVDYLLTSEARLDPADLAAVAPHHLGITRHYLRPSAAELTAALDAQPAEDATLY
ncbi:MAG: hypothetical protein ACRYFX_28065 [Janthinobacterium lividum]